MAATDDSRETIEDPSSLAEANNNKICWLQEHFEERISELEAENRELRRELAELKDTGGDF